MKTAPKMSVLMNKKHWRLSFCLLLYIYEADSRTAVYLKDPNTRRLTVSIRVHARVRAGLYRRSHAYARLYIDGPAVPSKCT